MRTRTAYDVCLPSQTRGLDVRRISWLVVLLLCPLLSAENCPSGQAKDESALVENEKTWALALEHHDEHAVGCLLAEEFQDADPDGQLHSRAETLAAIAHRKPGSNHLSELDAHIYGDFGYIRGLATLVNPQGATTAKVRFTDIYVYRDGRWVAVAGQESLVSEPKK